MIGVGRKVLLLAMLPMSAAPVVVLFLIVTLDPDAQLLQAVLGWLSALFGGLVAFCATLLPPRIDRRARHGLLGAGSGLVIAGVAGALAGIENLIAVSGLVLCGICIWRTAFVLYSER